MGRAGLMLAMAFLVLLPADASAVRFASPAGAGTDCSQDNPCSLAEAVGGAPAGDEVAVGPGTYMLGATGLQPTVPLTIRGTPGQRPTIASSGSFALSTPAAVAISDLVIDSRNAPYAVLATGAGSFAERVNVSSSTDSGATTALIPGSGFELRNSLLQASGPNRAEALFYQATETSTVTLRNVTAIARGPGSIALDIFATASAPGATIAATNVIADASLDVSATEDPASSSAINLFASNFSSGTGTIGGSGNQILPPKFVNAAGGDFHQATDSPTIDAGLTDDANGLLDLDGSPRVGNGRTDIGAYEVQPGATSSSSVAVPDTTAAAPGIGTLRLSRKGVFSTVLACPAAESRCRWSYALRSARSIRVKRKRRPLALGRGAASALGGRRVTIRIKLSKASFRLIKKRKRLRVKLTVKTRDAAANVATSKRIQTLKAPKRAAR